MKRSSEAVFFYALSAYLAVSLLLTAVALLAALAAMKALFLSACFTFGAEKIYRLKPLFYHSAGFALASCITALAQYYLVSLFAFTGALKRELGAISLFMSVFCGLFFWRGALFSALGAYPFSGLAVTLSALIGGMAAVFQTPAENPWPPAVSSYLR